MRDSLGMCDLCHDYFSIWSLLLTQDGKHFLCERCGRVTQLVECSLDKGRVVGANPTVTTNLVAKEGKVPSSAGNGMAR
jgi:hypothetical protein